MGEIMERSAEDKILNQPSKISSKLLGDGSMVVSRAVVIIKIIVSGIAEHIRELIGNAAGTGQLDLDPASLLFDKDKERAVFHSGRIVRKHMAALINIRHGGQKPISGFFLKFFLFQVFSLFHIYLVYYAYL